MTMQQFLEKIDIWKEKFGDDLISRNRVTGNGKYSKTYEVVARRRDIPVDCLISYADNWNGVFGGGAINKSYSHNDVFIYEITVWTD